MNIKGYVKLLSLPILAMSAIVLASFMGMFSTKGGTPRTQVYACPTPNPDHPPEPYTEGWCAQPIYDGKDFPNVFAVCFWANAGGPGIDITGKTKYLPYDPQKTTLGAYGIDGYAAGYFDNDSLVYWSGSDWTIIWAEDIDWQVDCYLTSSPSSVTGGGTFSAMVEWEDDDYRKDLYWLSYYYPSTNDGYFMKTATVKILELTLSQITQLKVGHTRQVRATVKPGVGGTFSWSTSTPGAVQYVVNGQQSSTATGNPVTIVGVGASTSASVNVSYTSQQDELNGTVTIAKNRQLVTQTTPELFRITTYYTPKEASFTGSRVMKYGLSVKSDWWQQVNGTNGNGEGWGLLDDTHGADSGKYMYCKGDLSSCPKGYGSRQLVRGASLATDTDQIPLDTSASFAIASPSTTNPTPGGIGPSINGTAVDGGSGIGEDHIDLYVGDRNKTGTSPSADAYVGDSWSNIAVTW